MIKTDVVIFGGGIAGLWTLNELQSKGYSTLLLENNALGFGQTITSQGIIHGGLKYTLQGFLTGSATQIREMPNLWRECLTGNGTPNLSNTVVRSEECYLWRTDAVSSRLGMIGAKIGLRVAAESLQKDERPEVLRNCPGTVSVMREQVISPASLLKNLTETYADRILKIDTAGSLQFERNKENKITAIHCVDPSTVDTLTIEPQLVVLTAGGGNAKLRQLAGLDSQTMQRRPLHMAMARGDLPRLNGHCVDGAKTRVTITADVDSQNNTVWQLGGQVAENGVRMDDDTLIRHTQDELLAVIPGIDLEKTEWSTYRVDRAEGKTKGGLRPEAPQVYQDSNLLTCWPTKLALAPQAAAEIIKRVEQTSLSPATGDVPPTNWTRPEVASPPWETCHNWQAYVPTQATRKRAA